MDSGGAATNSGSTDVNAADLSGTTNATVVSNKTFTDASVNTGTEKITITGHGYTSGSGCELTTTGVLPAGLALTTLYYIFSVDVDTITLHTNVADAEAGTSPVDITAAAGGGTHTVSNRTVNMPAADFSATPTAHYRVTTTGTSHVCTMGGGIHGMTTGDSLIVKVTSPGTIPTGLTAGNRYFANALSTTTFRLYSTNALAVAGGASDINVSAAGTGTQEIVHAKQASIFLNSASNLNKVIFWIRALSDANNLLIVDAVVTGLGAGSTWAIGGRLSAGTSTSNGCTAGVSVLRGGDKATVNTDIAQPAGTGWTVRNSGSATVGYVKIVGTTGARPVISQASATVVISTAFGYTWIENLELQQAGASANVLSGSQLGLMVYNVKVTDGGAAGILHTIQVGCSVIGCEVSGVLTTGIEMTGAFNTIVGNYVHDVTTVGIKAGYAATLAFNVVDRAASHGIQVPTGFDAYPVVLMNNSVYRCGSNGLDAPGSTGSKFLFSNIFKDNGNVGSEYNVNILASVPLDFSLSNRNCFSIAGGLGGSNVLNYTLDATDITGDPLFVDPDNGTAALRNFSLNDTSPCINTGFPGSFLGGSTVGYADRGAVQRRKIISKPTNISYEVRKSTV